MNSETIKTSNDSDVQKISNIMPLEDSDDDITRLKRKINNLLWEELPEKVTIGQAEVMACKIFGMMIE